MARQTINVGTAANDGTGDTLRAASQKINSNFIELYNDLGIVQPAYIQANAAFNKANSANSLAQAAFDRANTANAAVIQSTYDHANAAFDQANTSANIAQEAFNQANTALLANGSFEQANAAFNQANNSGSVAQSAFDAANNSGVLAQAAFDQANSAFDKANSANVLAQNAYDYANTAITNVSGLKSRDVFPITTGILSDGQSANTSINVYKGYILYKIQTSVAAWVRIYTDIASRNSDYSRSETTDPTPGSGVVAEVITTGSQTVLITPGTYGFNNESPVSNVIPLLITNKSGSNNTVTVTLTALQVEQ